MKEYVRTIADYPVKGIQFRDITTLLQNAGHFKQVIDDMVKPWQNKKIDAVLSIESRGFIMAGAIAYFLNAAFVPGGTALAAVELIKKFEDKNIVGAGFIINLPDLSGDKKLIEKGIEIHSLMEF